MRQILLILALVLAPAQETAKGPVTIKGPVSVGGTASTGFSPSFVSVTTCSALVGSTGCTTTAASVTAGQFTVCYFGDSAGGVTTFTVTDTDGDTGGSAPSGSPVNVAFTSEGLFRLPLTHTNASEVFTLTTNAGSGAFVGGCAIYNGTPTAWDVAVAGHQNSSTTSFLTGTTSATANAAELASVIFTVNAPASLPTITGTNGYTCRATTVNSTTVGAAYCDKILAATGTQQGTATAGTSLSGDGIIATTK